MTDYSGIPGHMRQGVMDYLEKGYTPGSFLYAVLCNDLTESAAQADDINKHLLFEWASFMYNEVPSVSRGSSEKVDKYLQDKKDK